METTENLFSLTNPLLYITPLTGLGTGLLAALFGVGGGFIFTPFFHAFLGLPAINAVATSTSIIPFTALGGVREHITRKTIRYKTAWLFTAGSIPAGQITIYLLHLLDISNPKGAPVTDLLVGGLFIAVVASSLIYKFLIPSGKKNLREREPLNIVVILFGAFTGAISSILGVGGGLIAVPFFIQYCRMSPVQATATSLFTILPLSFINLIHFFFYKSILFPFSLLMIAGSMVGATIGTKIAHYIPDKKYYSAIIAFQITIALSYIITLLVRSF